MAGKGGLMGQEMLESSQAPYTGVAQSLAYHQGAVDCYCDVLADSVVLRTCSGT